MIKVNDQSLLAHTWLARWLVHLRGRDYEQVLRAAEECVRIARLASPIL